MGYQNNNYQNNGKQNQNNNQQQKKKPPKVHNPDPMSNMRTMAREGMRIIRDIAYGRFNIFNEGHIFRDPDFVKATIAEVDKRILEVDIHIKAIECAYAGIVNENSAVLSVLNRDKKSYEAYVLIRNTLESILINSDTGFLLVLANRLPNYKYNI